MKKGKINLGTIAKKDIELIYKYDNGFGDVLNAEKLTKIIENKFTGMSGNMSKLTAIAFAYVS